MENAFKTFWLTCKTTIAISKFRFTKVDDGCDFIKYHSIVSVIKIVAIENASSLEKSYSDISSSKGKSLQISTIKINQTIRQNI
jgi:RNA recognition motif-containing protein